MFSAITSDFTFFAISSAFLAAIANILARTLLKDLKSKDILGINFLTMVMILLLFSPVFYHFEATIGAILLIALMSFIDTVANYFYFKTFENTEASIATPILSLAPGITFLTGYLIIGDTTDLKSFILAVLIIFGVIIFSTDFKNFKDFKAATLIPAMSASFLFGLSAIPAKILLDSQAIINAPTLYLFRGSFIGFFSLIIFGFTIPKLQIKQYRFLCFRSLFVIGQWVLLYYALSIANAGVSITLGNITPIFVFILSIIFLKEKISLKKAITATLILILSLLI